MRIDLYLDPIASVHQPRSVTPCNHTMQEDAFISYIGCSNRKELTIEPKKFNKEQIALLRRAYLEVIPVRIVAAYRRDTPELASRFGYNPIAQTVTHFKRDKRFNCWRQSMQMVDCGKDQARQELWISVFPSKQHVDQIAELIQSIYNDFDARINGSLRKPDVFTAHSPELESTIACWTGFDAFAARWVRHGDIVIFGNVESIIPGLDAIGFKPRDDWSFGGLDNMFGAQVFNQRQSGSRVVLFGFTESFWGDAIGQYTAVLLKLGVKHILYGSKAATLHEKRKIGSVVSPAVFYNIHRTSRRVDGELKFEAMLQDEAKHIASVFDIRNAGISITVPTVIGEDYKEASVYGDTAPACMDCENGHIAEAVVSYNREAQAQSAHARFIPVHFITDYIHKPGERPDEEQNHLGRQKDDKDEQERSEAFLKIGRFFGLYALIFALRDHLKVPTSIYRSDFDAAAFEKTMSEVRKMLERGFGREAVATLAAAHSDGETTAVHLLAMATACQKYGFTDNAFRAITALSHRDVAADLSPAYKLKIAILDLKLHCQIGSFDVARGIASRIQQEFDLNGDAEKAAALQRRVALIEAAGADWLAAEKHMAAAAKLDADARAAGGNPAIHAEETNQLFRLIIKLTKSRREMKSLNLLNERSVLSGIRRGYWALVATGDRWWETNFRTYAIVALFLESAFYLLSKDRRYRSKGLARLYVCHLLNMRTGGNERAETVGEIIALCDSAAVRELMALAMRRDAWAQYAFQSSAADMNPAVIEITDPCLGFFEESPNQWEDHLDEIMRLI